MRTALHLTLWLSACSPASSPEAPTPSTADNHPPYPPLGSSETKGGLGMTRSTADNHPPYPLLGPIYNNNELCPQEMPAVVQYRVDTEAEWNRGGPYHYSNVYKMAMRCGAERFELILGTGYYGGGGVEIDGYCIGPNSQGKTPKHRPFSVVVRGVGPEPPTAGGLCIFSGDHVTIQNLRFQHAGGGSTFPYIWVQAEQTLNFSNVHVSDCRFSMMSNLPIVLEAPVINLEESSFIGNKVVNATCLGWTGNGKCEPEKITTALMELSGDEVNLRRVAFAGNDADWLLLTDGRLTLDEVAAVGLEDQTVTGDLLKAVTLRNSTLAFGGHEWLTRWPSKYKRARPKIKNSLIVNPATLAPGALEALNRAAAEKPPTAAELAAAIRALPKK